MKLLLVIAFLNAAFLSTVIAAEDGDCYEWDDDNRWIKGICHECMQKPTKLEIEQCLNTQLLVTDDEGNVVPEKIRNYHYLLGLKGSRNDSMIESMKDCGKGVEPLKLDNMENLKIIDEIWECADAGMRTVCPEAYDRRTPWRDDVDIKGCQPSFF